MNKKKTLEEFIQKSKLKHDNKYDYSLVNYVNCDTKIKIICSEHGIFEQTPSSHYKSGCPKCAYVIKSITKTKNVEKFIDDAKKIHGDKYDYSLVKYVHSYKKIKILCPTHGIFEQRPSLHLSYGCYLCNKSVKLSQVDFIEKCKKIHDNKYDYSITIYKNTRCYINIICPKHGIFNQLSGNHLKGMGCSECDNDKRKIKIKDFIERSNNIHNNKYDYSTVKYINSMSKIKIICPSHGEFSQTPHNHLIQKNGCPICKESKGERKISTLLKKYNIEYEREYIFDNCKNINKLPFDFYLPDHNICKEYDGKQHYEPNEFFGGEIKLLELQKRDKIKNDYCKENNINLVRIRYDDIINDKLIKLFQN